MPVIGFAFNKFEGTREKAQPSGDIKVNSTPKILSVKEVAASNLKDKPLALDWEFNTGYEPNIGSMQITGSILYIAKDNKPILDKWKKDKTLPEDVSVEILNQLFRRCLLKSANMAEDLQLPPPLNFPVVKKK